MSSQLRHVCADEMKIRLNPASQRRIIIPLLEIVLMTDFFEQQDQARKATFRLLVLYVLGVIGTCVTLHLGISAALSFASSPEESTSFSTASFVQLALNPLFAVFTLGITSLIIVLSSVYKMASLRAGGSVVAREMGGREILNTTQDLLERRLLNVVEEMAISSGIAMPRVFVLDQECGMNAFAAGFSSKDAAVAVTRGLLEIVQRDELQAVIGHEFSHVLNGDMRLNIRLVGILYGIFALAIIGRVLIEIGLRSSSRGSSNKKNNSLAGLAAVGIVCWLVGQIGFFFGRLIQSSISRQREFLADASAVQFTRNPLGLCNALKLIGAAGSRLANPNTSEVSHMLFASGLESMFATHPPIASRIRRLDPNFDGNFSEARLLLDKRHTALAAMASSAQEKDSDDSSEAFRNLKHVVPGGMSIPGLDHEDGEIVGAALAMAWLNDADRQALRNIPTAIACVCGCLISEDEAVRERQMEMLPYLSGNSDLLRQMVDEWSVKMREWSITQRRKICELAVTGLRNEPRELREKLSKAVQALSSADDIIEPFEFAIGCMISRRLLPDDSIAHARRPPVPPRQVVNEIIEVLSVIAQHGAKDQTEMRPALEAGLKRLLPFIGEVDVRTLSQSVDARKLERALQELERLAPLLKREFMQACEVIILYDGEICETEETFLYAIADAIDAISWNAKLQK
jgi:Zn-dependent protease with chaperone function